MHVFLHYCFVHGMPHSNCCAMLSTAHDHLASVLLHSSPGEQCARTRGRRQASVGSLVPNAGLGLLQVVLADVARADAIAIECATIEYFLRSLGL